MLDQLKRLVGSLTRKQQILIVLAAISVAGGLFWFLQSSRDRDYKPLFTGLAPEDAGHVVAKLKEANVDYRLSGGGSVVLVRSARVADTRLLIAGAGLPKSGRIGFEIFDKTNLGATDFSEQINFRRALEGELERSVMSLSEVEQARVHISFTKESVFTESRQPAKASVLIKLRQQAKLSPQNVTAIEHLVAAAVEGLAPEGVTVVDMEGNLFKKVVRGPDQLDSDGPIEYRQKIERDLLAKVNATLTPILGPDHFRAGVSVEVDFSSGEQSEETWDPDRSVMLSQQRSEEMSAPAAASGIPGTQSNLPRPTSRPGSSGSQLVRRTENVTYQSSRLVRKMKLPQGSVRRLSVSTILDQTVRWEGTGAKARRILEPPSDEMLKKVRDMVAGAIGFSQERGDQLIVQSLPFESTLRIPPPPDPVAPQPLGKQETSPGLAKWLAEKNIKVTPVILGAAAGILFLVVGAGVFLLLKKRKRKERTAAAKGIATAEGKPELPEGASKTSAIPSPNPESSLERKIEKRLAEQEAQREKAELEVLDSLKMPAINTKKAEVLIKHIAEQAKRNPAGAAQLIRTWIGEKEERY